MNVTMTRSAVRAVLGVLGAAAVAVGALFAFSANADATQTGIAAEELPPSAVEDFSYPEPLQQAGFRLIRGDGHIVHVDCASSEANLDVYARANGVICFRVTGSTGYLAVEIPAVYGVITGDYDSTFDLITADGDEVSYDVPPNGYQAIGETDGEVGKSTVLLEIRSS